MKGPEETPYEGGYYHGKLIFPGEFPFQPPSIYMNTPNGRFKVNTRLCLSISDFHPDTWNPTWSVSSILLGLLSFMVRVYIYMSGTIASVSNANGFCGRSRRVLPWVAFTRRITKRGSWQRRAWSSI